MHRKQELRELNALLRTLSKKHPRLIHTLYLSVRAIARRFERGLAA